MGTTPQNLYKYRLKEFFIAYFGCQAAAMRRQCKDTIGISMPTIKRDFNRVMTDPETIPAERLEQYAKFLNIENPTALRNHFHQNLAA